MAFTIAVSGKGGSGKTTTASMVIRYLVEEVGEAVLAVDADPNSSLELLLGVEVTGSISDIREDVVERRVNIPEGMSKDRFIEYQIQSAIVEAKGFDLLSMGRPEGPKCYCYVNNLLRGFLDNAAPPGMGLRFLEISHDDEIVIDRYIEAHESIFFD